MPARECPFCGAELKTEILNGLCPKCVLKQIGATEVISAAPDSAHQAGRTPAAGQSVVRNPQSEMGRVRYFGDYELLEETGRGGMGVVFKARQRSLNRIVAVKMIRSERLAREADVRRFHLEAAAAAKLQHPNIVALHEAGEVEGQHFYSMDFVEGRSLAQRISDLRFRISNFKQSARWLKTIAEAVHYAHEHGILHRDLKPSNILIDAHDTPRVTDFGLAKRLTTDAGCQMPDAGSPCGGTSSGIQHPGSSIESLTLTGQVMGSPSYMSPEQAAGRSRDVDARTDVYALGAILYELVSGRPPFKADTSLETLKLVVESEPVSPRLLIPRLPHDLETICLKCLEKEPSRRYASAQLLADELGRFLRGEPILARPVSRPEKVWRWCRRKPALAAALGAVVLVAVVGFAGVVSQWRRAKANELFARQNSYAADMLLAQHALTDNDVGLALRLLNKHWPAAKSEIRHPKSEMDLRGWEWRYLWQLCQADASIRLQTNSGSFGALAISQDGRVLAAQTGRDKVVLWDLMTKRQVAELPGSEAIQLLVLSPRGDRLAVSSRNARGEPTLEVWDANPPVLRTTLDQPAPLVALAFSPDDALLATMDERGGVVLVEWLSNQTVTTFSVRPLRHKPAGAVAFSPDGSRLAIGEDYGRINLLSWRTGAVVTMTNVNQAGDGVAALAFSPSAELLASAIGNAVQLWDAHSGAPHGQLREETGFPTALAFTPDSRLLASVSDDRMIRVWSVADQAELHHWRGHAGEARALAFLPDGKTLVSGCKVGAACFWDLTATNRSAAHASLRISFGAASQTGLEPTDFVPGALDPKAVRRLGFTFTADGRRLITTDPYGLLEVWDTKSVQKTETLAGLGSNYWGVALSPDGRWLAAGHVSGKIHILDWQTRRPVASLELPIGWFGQLKFSRSGRHLQAMAAFNDRTSRFGIWRTENWQPVPLASVQVAGLYSADLSRDDRLLAVGYGDGTVKLWYVPSGRHETTFTNSKAYVFAVAFSPDSRLLASASWDGTVRLWDVSVRRELATFPGPARGVWGVAFSPDGRRLATGGSSSREAVKVWDLATRRELLSLQGEGDWFTAVAFSPDGSALMATSWLGVAHLWRAPSWAEIDAVEKRQVVP